MKLPMFHKISISKLVRHNPILTTTTYNYLLVDTHLINTAKKILSTDFVYIKILSIKHSLLFNYTKENAHIHA